MLAAAAASTIPHFADGRWLLVADAEWRLAADADFGSWEGGTGDGFAGHHVWAELKKAFWSEAKFGGNGAGGYRSGVRGYGGFVSVRVFLAGAVS